MFLNSPATDSNHLEAIATPVAIWQRTADAKLSLESANQRYDQITDNTPDTRQLPDISAVLPRYIIPQVRDSLNQCLSQQRSVEDELVIERHGQTRWWRFIYSPLVEQDGRVYRVMNTCIEITEKKELERHLETSMKRFEAVINSAYDGIITIDSQQNIKMFNQAAGEMFGLDPENAIGMPLESLIPARYRPNHSSYVAGFNESPVMSRPMHTRAAVTGLRRDGVEFPLEITISKIRVGYGTEMTAVLRDISERAKLIEELREAASIDALTSAYNRRYFDHQLEIETKRCQRFEHQMALVMFDLDHFKQLNDSQGHNFGDTILTGVAELVASQLREVDILARWGGDEFTLLLPETDLEQAKSLAERIRLMVADNYQHLPQPSPTLSLGIVVSNGCQAPKALIEAVDKQLYKAKKNGRNQVSGELLSK